MNDKDYSALAHKEQELFSNTYAPSQSVKHQGGSYMAKDLPHAWGDNTPLKDTPRSTTSFGAMFLIFSLVALIAAVSFTGWKFINKKNVVSNANIATEISIKPFVEGGENTTLSYSIQNNNSLPLENAVFTISYEKGSGAQDEQNKKQEKITLGNIAAGELRKGDIQIQLYGAENSSRDVTGRLEYKVNGSNSSFSKSVIATTVLKTPPVSVHIESDATVSAEEAYPITIRIKNTTSNVMDPAMLSLTLPASYVVTEYSEKPFNKNPAWRYEALNPGEEKSILIKGHFKGLTGEAMNIKAVVGSQGTQLGNIANVYSSDSRDVTISAQSLALSVALTEETGDIAATTVLPGSRVRAVVTYENKSDVALSISSIVAHIGGNKFDATSVSPDSGLFDSTDNTITWTGATQSMLNQIAPGDRGSLIATFTVSPDALTDAPLVIDVKGVATTLDQSKVFTSKESKSWFVQGGAQISGAISYKNSSITNTGPLPPVANQTTTYTITLSAQSQSILKNSVASLKLPLYVSWKNVILDNAPITYNDRTRTVSWNIGNLNKGTSIRASFQVGVRPSLTHVGGMPTITNGIVFEGVDAVSGQTVKDTGAPLTTYLGQETLKKDISTVVAPDAQ